ncbi:MAG: heavy metal translocating P-type ATPase [Candidatus Omnitrophota bacterium]
MEKPTEADQPKHKHHGHKHEDHTSHHAHMVADFRKRFWISLALSLPILVLSPLIQSFFHYTLTFAGRSYVLLVLSSIVYFYGGWPFLTGLFKELRKKQPGMMTLIALAISVAYFYSAAVVLGVPGKIFFWELVTLIDVMLLGHWIEMRSVMGASRALEELAQLMPSEAHRLDEQGNIEDVAIEDLKKGDRVLIKPSEKVPVDGEITEGESDLNEAMITGESKPVPKKQGDEVIGGSVNGEGAITVTVTKAGKDSYLSQVIDMVKKAGESKSQAQNFADRAAFWLTMIAITVGLGTFAVWFAVKADFVYALERMVTVMVITCPHALGLAIPLVIAVITSLSAKNGLLIRNRTAFEEARDLDTIVFDKTGTLTQGKFGISVVRSLGEWSEDDLIARAAAVERNSEHTIARGIVRSAEERSLDIPKADSFKALPGKGAQAKINNQDIYIGNTSILDVTDAQGTEDAKKAGKETASDGKTVVFVIADGTVQGIIGLADIIREESKEAIRMLKEMGIGVSMITGDNEETARSVSEDLELTDYFAEIMPEKKSEKIKDLQQKGRKVAMVGDGINDAPALAQADVGIAIGAGTDVAAETADVVLVKSDPRHVADVIKLSRITRRKTWQNLAWATGYNVFAIPLAAGVLYVYGIILAPAVGALIMSLSTVIVAVNARLITYTPSTES